MYQHSVVPSLRLAYSGRPYILWRVQGAHGKSPVVSQCAHSIRILHHYAALCKVSTARYHHTPRIGADFKLGMSARQPTTAHRFVETRNRLSQDAMCVASTLLHEAYCWSGIIRSELYSFLVSSVVHEALTKLLYILVYLQ
jgi:hypothetical protein